MHELMFVGSDRLTSKKLLGHEPVSPGTLPIMNGGIDPITGELPPSRPIVENKKRSQGSQRVNPNSQESTVDVGLLYDIAGDPID